MAGSPENPTRISDTLRARSLKGVLWTSFEGISVAALSLGGFAVMAHILQARDFGVIALAGVFVYSFNLIVGSSFSDALVQRAELNPQHTNAAFWSTLVMALVLTNLCSAGASTAAQLLHEPRLADVLPWLAWIMPLGAISAVQTALFRRELRFRVVAIWSTAGRVTGAVVGIGMAVAGFGVWSLVGQQIAGVLVTSVGIASVSAWRPRFQFSFRCFHELWKFGFHVSASHTVNGMSEQAVNLLVGSMFGSVVLGYFSIAWRMMQLVCSLTGNAVYHVGFSAFSRLKEDRAATARAIMQATRLSCLFGFPVGAGIALLAAPIIALLFGHKWENSAPLLALLAIEIIPTFYAMFFSACFRAMGHPGWALGLALLYAMSGIAAILLLAPLGIWAVAGAWIVRSFILMPVPISLLQRVLSLSMVDVLAPAVMPAIATAVMSAVVGGFVWMVGDGIGSASLLLTAVPIGIGSYVAAIAMLSPDLLQTAIRTIKIMGAPSRIADGGAL